MQIIKCPKCGELMLKINTIGDSTRNLVDLSLENATQFTKCRNCGKKVKFSVKKVIKGEEYGRNKED